jgi:trimeric autotransporter adhesin
MKLAASLSKLLAALRAANTNTRTESAALPAPLIVALEPRIVYDASAAAIGAAAAPHHHEVHAETHAAASAARDAANPPAAVSSFAAAATAERPATAQAPAAEARDGRMSTPGDGAATQNSVDTTAVRDVHGYSEVLPASTDKQVVFINSNVTDFQTLVAGLPQGTQYVILDSTKDGLAQMEQYLQQHPGVSAIHLVSHGADGEVQIGSTWLNEGDLSAYSAELSQIGAAMKPGGDFLIYGCDVAQQADGKLLVQQIASITQLNVAASTDATGAASLGGDWVLEYDAGTVHTPVIFSTAAEQQYSALLAVTNETYDNGDIGYVTPGGAAGVTTFTLDGITYTLDQPSEFAVDSTTVNQVGPPPLSTGPTDGVLLGNVQSNPLNSMTMALTNGDNMAVKSFDIDISAPSVVAVEALDGSGSVLGTVTLNTANNGNNSVFHVDVSGNAAFSSIKSLKFVETDGNFLTPTLNNFSYVDLVPPPVVTASGGSASFVAGDNVASTPVKVDSGLTLSDSATGTLTSATVAITGNFQSGEDVLSFTNNPATMGNIVASYSAPTGVMTLTSAGGTATVAQWTSALRSVTYTDMAVTPNSATRTISFSVTDSLADTSATVTRTVTVTDTDQTPKVTTTGGTTTYSEGSAATTIDSGVHVSDLDNTTQASGTVVITGGLNGGDTLSFTNNGSTMGNITGSFNSATGVLTLTSAGSSATDTQWANALSAVAFSTTSTTLGNRTISFATSDGTKTSTAATDTVNVTNPVQLTLDSGSAAFVAADNAPSTPVAVDSGLTLSDSATSTLSTATVAITGNFHSSEDMLSFTNNGTTMGNITASYSPATGLMTLSSAGGTATVAQWTSALQSVTYVDTAVTPNSATRTISFSVTDSVSNTSNTATRTVTVADTDQTPQVTTTGGTTSYVGGSSAVTIDGGVHVSDLDNTTQASGTVVITGNFHSGDTLSFTNNGSTMGNIVGSYNAATGVLTLTSASSSATDAQWANALSSVTFSSTSTSYGNRTISFNTSDGTKTSPTVTDTVNITAPPQITTDSGSAAFVAGDNVVSTPVTIDSGLTVSDGNATTLGSAVIAITGNFHSGEDVLAFTNNGTTMGNISGSYNATTGVLTLTSASASATLTQWQNALQSVTYTDVSITPNPATRTISFTATDGAGNTSSTATRTVTVADTDQTPIVTTTGGTTNYVGGTSAAKIDSGITVSDRDNATQSSGTVSITSGFHSGDTLSFVNTSSPQFGNIVGSFNAATGVLTLTSTGGTANDTQWANAFSAVAFSAGSSATPGNRTISFTVNDGTRNSSAATDTVAVLGPPIITTDSGSAAFTAGDNSASTPVQIDSGLSLSDGTSSTLSSATVAITGNFHGGEDVLGFTNNGTTMGNITASYNVATGVMTLTSAGGTATVLQWTNALQSVTYTDTAVTPNNSTRTISFTAVDSGSNVSNTATRTVTVADVDQTPILTTTGGTTNYVGGAAAATIDGGITLSDLDNTTQASGTVSITSGFHSGDTLSYVNTSSVQFGNIVGSYNAGTGVLTLTSSGDTASNGQWANALSAVTFSAGSAATPGNRTISFVINDGTKNSAAATDTVDVIGAPQITTDSGSAAFTAGDNVASTPVTIDSGLTLTDGGAPTLASATVAITGNFHAGEDVLGFTNNGTSMGNIAASYNASTGVLTLTSAGATASLTQWQAALSAVTYTDTAITPNSATRTITFAAVDTGATISNTATRTVTVADTDQTPIVTTTGGTTSYAGSAPAVTIDGGISVTDRDNTTQGSGTVSVTSGFHSGDTLGFVNNGSTMGNIVGSYNSATGVLTLTSSGATATDAQWANALSSVTFSSTSATLGNRTISFTTNDGTKTSTTATDTVSITAPPVITTDSGSAAFVAGDNVTSTPVTIDSGLTLTDGSATTLASTTVAITGNFHSGEDVLSFTNNGTSMGNITASYNAVTGVMTLSSAGATATLAQWQSALQSVTYTDTAITPNNATRTISFTSTDGAGNTSATATRTVTIADTDQTPIVTTTGATTNYVGGTSAATVDGSISVSDRDNTTQSSGTVSITTGFHSGDTLSFTNTSSGQFGNIVGSYNAATGVLTLTSVGGTASNAQWASAFAAVKFSAGTSATPGDRTISFTINDGTKNSAAVTDTVDVLAPPKLTTDAGSTAFVAGDNATSMPVAIDSGLTVSDGSAATLGTTTVAITGGFHAGEDVLAFTNNGTTMGNISASYNATTGVLTLTSSGATATLAQWQSALQSLTYTDTAVTPNTATRTISFTSTDGAGNTSATATRTVTIADTDQTPIVTATSGTTIYVAGGAASVVNPGVSVTDRDNPTQSSGTVSITGNFHNGDVLAFTNTNATTFGNISASYNAATGVLTLTSAGSTATDAQWSAALSAVTFSSTNTALGNRTISFSTSDGTKTSIGANATVSMLDRPHVTTDAGPTSFVAGDNVTSTPVVVSPRLTLTDASVTGSGGSPTLSSASVAITGGFHAGQDVLAFTNDNSTMGNIQASYNANTGVLTLTSAGGSASIAQWRAALASVTYTDTAVVPDNTARTVSFTVTDSNGAASDVQTRVVTVTDTDQTPTLSVGGSVTFTAQSFGAVPVAVAPQVTVGDRDPSAALTSAQIAISGGFDPSHDKLALSGSAPSGFTASYNANTGVLTVTWTGTGKATLAQWQSALEAVTYSNSAFRASGSRTVTFTISDGVKTSVAATNTITTVTGRSGGTPTSALPTTSPVSSTDTSTATLSSHLAGSENTGAPAVLDEFHDIRPIGSVPVVPTMTFADPNAPAGEFSIDHTTVPKFDATALDATLAVSPASEMPASLSDVNVAVPQSDPFSIDVATLLPPSLAMQGGASDVTVQMANGRSLPGWIHYDAAAGVLRGKVPPGVQDVRIVVSERDAAGHVIQRDVVLAPHKRGTGHHVAHPHAQAHQPPHADANPNGDAPRDLAQPLAARALHPVGKPSLDQQFAQARAALHVVRPAGTVRSV